MEKVANLRAPPRDWRMALGFRKTIDILVPILSLKMDQMPWALG